MSKNSFREVMVLIRGAVQNKKSSVVVPYSKKTKSLITILHEHGFVREYFYVHQNGHIVFSFCIKKNSFIPKNKQPRTIYIYLRSMSNSISVSRLTLVFTPFYARYTGLLQLANGLHPARLIIVNTSKGLRAFQKGCGIGGEVFCIVWSASI
jgi:ribosomal protein S8